MIFSIHDLLLLCTLLVLWSCEPSPKPTEVAKKQVLEIPVVSNDVIVARLAPHLIAAPETLAEKEINFLLDHAMEQSWDVHFHPSGVLYNLKEEGEGRNPDWGDYVSAHYEGRNLQGKLFDSSRARGQAIKFYVGNMIAGWNEVLQNLLRPGGRGLFIIPAHLAYGKDGFGKYVAPDEHLIFDLELLEILPDPNQ